MTDEFVGESDAELVDALYYIDSARPLRCDAARTVLLARLSALRAERDAYGTAMRQAVVERDQARALLARIVKYAHEDRAVTPGFTRLARALDEAGRLLCERRAEVAEVGGERGGEG